MQNADAFDDLRKLGFKVEQEGDTYRISGRDFKGRDFRHAYADRRILDELTRSHADELCRSYGINPEVLEGKTTGQLLLMALSVRAVAQTAQAYREGAFGNKPKDDLSLITEEQSK